MNAMRSVGLILTVLILLMSAFNGLKEGPSLIGEAENGRQQFVAFAQIVSGLTAIVALVGLWRRRNWTLAATSLWAATTTLLGAVASIAWTDVRINIALLAGLMTAVVTGWVVWFVWYQSRWQSPS